MPLSKIEELVISMCVEIYSRVRKVHNNLLKWLFFFISFLPSVIFMMMFLSFLSLSLSLDAFSESVEDIPLVKNNLQQLTSHASKMLLQLRPDYKRVEVSDGKDPTLHFFLNSNNRKWSYVKMSFALRDIACTNK